MKKLLIGTLALAALLACLMAGGGALAEGVEDFLGIWVADGAAAEIWREKDDLFCRIVFMEAEADESRVWDYSGCGYDAEENALQCGCVTRTRERLDPLWDTLIEDDWSLNDMPFSRFDRTEDGLRFSDDELEAPVDFTRLGEGPAGPRDGALAFLGRWAGEGATLRVEDHGVACQFIITARLDDSHSGSWTYTCRYDAEEGRMVSVDVSPRRLITWAADGGYTEEEVGRDPSEAVFTLEDADHLLWSDVTDGDGEDMAFARQAD